MKTYMIIALSIVLVLVLAACSSETPEPVPTVEDTQPTPTLSAIEGDPAALLGKPDGLDTFDTANNWTLFNNQCFKSEITNGKFEMESKGLAGIVCWEVTWPQIQDYYLESQVFTPDQCQAEDRFGLFFRAPDNYRGYLYGLTCDGQFSLTMWDGNTTKEIVSPSRSDAINTGPGAMNRLGVIAYGGDYILYANGVLVAEAQDFTYIDPGKIGYFVRAATDQGFLTSFDNLAVWLLQDDYYPPSAPPPPNTGELPPPPDGVPAVTTVTWVNVRSGPGLYYPIYFVALPGTSAEAVGITSDNEWYQIKVPTTVSGSGLAWMSADYVIARDTANLPVVNPPALPPGAGFPPPDAQEPTVTNFEPINVRSGPGTQFPSYGVAPRGSTAPVLGISEDGTWYAVRVPTSLVPNGTGWVNANYVVLSNPAGLDIPVITNPEELPPIEHPPPAEGAPTVTTTDVVNSRSGPSTVCESYGVSTLGATAEVLGISSDGLWYEVVLPPDLSPIGRGWVNANYVVLSNPAGVAIPVTQSEICP